MEQIKNFFSRLIGSILLSLLFILASVMVIFMPDRTIRSMRAALKEW